MISEDDLINIYLYIYLSVYCKNSAAINPLAINIIYALQLTAFPSIKIL